MPDDWRRAVAVVAHPDDLEYGCSAAVASWAADGRQVAYVLATRGEAGIDTLAPERARSLREAEQRAAAAAVGVSTVEFLDHRDGVIQYGVPLRRDIAAAVRRHRPEMVITLNHRDTWAHGAFDPRSDVKGVDDLTLFPDLADELRYVPVADGATEAAPGWSTSSTAAERPGRPSGSSSSPTGCGTVRTRSTTACGTTACPPIPSG
jgi:LmbE family N-acetylglucosaminyl deacetylase